MRTTGKAAVLIAGFVGAFAILIAIALAGGGLLHWWVPAIELGTAVLIAVTVLCSLMISTMLLMTFGAMPLSTMVADSNDNEDDDDDAIEELDEAQVEIIAKRVALELLDRAESGTTIGESGRRRRRH